MESTVSIGDRVVWRGSFGMDAPKGAVIETMEVTDTPRCKYGTPASTVTTDLIRSNRVVFGLTNGHWCYSEQIELPRSRTEVVNA
jgi:hypothetical protein